MSNHISLATIVPQNEPVLDADWIPADDDVMDLIQKHQELEDAFQRLARRERYPAYWDYRNPRTAEEYLHNNRKRDRNKDRRVTAFVQRFFVGSLAFFGLAVTMALLVG